MCISRLLSCNMRSQLCRPGKKSSMEFDLSRFGPAVNTRHVRLARRAFLTGCAVTENAP